VTAVPTRCAKKVLPVPEDTHDRVHRKVLAIFTEIAGDRAKRLDSSVVSHAAKEAITAALAE
jgi:hypothetical protein